MARFRPGWCLCADAIADMPLRLRGFMSLLSLNEC